MKEDSLIFRVVEIIRGTTVDGPGFRTSIYFSGCRHKCDGCHNPETHDPDSGKKMSIQEIMDVVNEEDFDVTLSGGDPLYNPESTALLVRELKKNRRNIWIYTGYTWEEIIADTQLFDAINKADVVVDGRFILNLKDSDLKFRGSRNQRIIDVKKSLDQGKVILFLQ